MTTRLVGIYNADGGLFGEARYVVGHILGFAECSLCDITHSPLRRKPQWDAFVKSLEMEFALLHRNEVSPRLAEWLADKTLPLVVLETDTEFHTLLGPSELSAARGSVDAFAIALSDALAQA
jgi:hypothetical protein